MKVLARPLSKMAVVLAHGSISSGPCLKLCYRCHIPVRLCSLDPSASSLVEYPICLRLPRLPLPGPWARAMRVQLACARHGHARPVQARSGGGFFPKRPCEDGELACSADTPEVLKVTASGSSPGNLRECWGPPSYPRIARLNRAQHGVRNFVGHAADDLISESSAGSLCIGV